MNLKRGPAGDEAMTKGGGHRERVPCLHWLLPPLALDRAVPARDNDDREAAWCDVELIGHPEQAHVEENVSGRPQQCHLSCLPAGVEGPGTLTGIGVVARTTGPPLEVERIQCLLPPEVQ